MNIKKPSSSFTPLNALIREISFFVLINQRIEKKTILLFFHGQFPHKFFQYISMVLALRTLIRTNQ